MNNKTNPQSHFESVDRVSQIAGMNTASFVANKLKAESLNKGAFGGKMTIDNILSEQFVKKLIKDNNLKVVVSEYQSSYSSNTHAKLYMNSEFAFVVSKVDPTKKDKEFYYVASSLYAKDKRVFDKVLKLVLENFSSPKKSSSIKVLSSSFGEIVTRDVKTPEWNKISIKNEYYNTDFPKFNKRMKGFLDKRCNSALCMLFGDVGTGKTTYLRKFMADHPEKDFIYIPVSMVGTLSSPTFMDFLAENEEVVIILEDAEKVVAQRGSGQSDECAVSNLLQMTDGILNDIFKTKIIITFNCEIEKIDEALTRSGRLFASYEFKNLTKARATNLMKKLKLDHSKIVGETSLAEIFNTEEISFTEKTTTKIGFKK